MAVGRDLVVLARRHVGERYDNVLVPKNHRGWKGPWDCAEFTSWCVFQVAGFLYGCTDDAGDPATTEAYTGAWQHDAKTRGRMVPVAEAAVTAGAVVLRYPPAPGHMGHIAFCDGSGGTVEAHSRTRGVIRDVVAGRRWDTGVLVPGIEFVRGAAPLPVSPPKTVIYRLTDPWMEGPTVKTIQRALKKAGFSPGKVDGRFGPFTHAAVVAFQQKKSLVSDGEVGPRTAKRLGVDLPEA